MWLHKIDSGMTVSALFDLYIDETTETRGASIHR
jgi:hypothetical protein